ncbi:hypothetical protein ACQP1G_21560 [Nocardia sp. CA-107356]|uniref:hypothetical protein n=1 Tax=Nocardia sp. CA-107356 TaxID=3239972 RepID=UPI003D8EFD5D
MSEVADTWTGTTWFVEGDVADCFGSLDHQVLLAILAEKIHDNRFLRLMQNMLKAGYLEEWTWNATLSGAPQGGVVSPIAPVDWWLTPTVELRHERPVLPSCARIELARGVKVSWVVMWDSEGDKFCLD